MSRHVCACVSATSTHSNKNLSTAVNDLDVLVVYEAAHDGDVGMALCGADPRSLLHLVPHAARPMFAPPRVVGGDVKRQQVTVLEGRQKRMSKVLYVTEEHAMSSLGKPLCYSAVGREHKSAGSSVMFVCRTLRN